MGYEEAKELMAQAERARAEAIEELLNQRLAIDVKLDELGYGDLEKPSAAKPPARKKATGIAAVCQVCGFGTTPPHDQRFRVHKEQAEKKPLTPAELKAAGLARKQPTSAT